MFHEDIMKELDREFSYWEENDPGSLPIQTIWRIADMHNPYINIGKEEKCSSCLEDFPCQTIKHIIDFLKEIKENNA